MKNTFWVLIEIYDANVKNVVEKKVEKILRSIYHNFFEF